MTNAELIAVIAHKLGLSKKKAAVCLRVVVDSVLEGIEEDEYVKIQRLGCLKLEVQADGGRVVFKDSRILRRTFSSRRQGESRMEKLGVELNNDRVMEARISGKCPDCGADLPKGDGKAPVSCRKCGTKPFEMRDNEGDQG